MEAGLSLLEKGELNAFVLPRRRTPSPSSDLCDGLQGPCRLLRLCILGIVVPACLIAIPVYIRYHVLHEQQYPVAYSDVRLIDGRVSTTWCQVQNSNACNINLSFYFMEWKSSVLLVRKCHSK
jgi:hypothetical protein